VYRLFGKKYVVPIGHDFHFLGSWKRSTLTQHESAAKFLAKLPTNLSPTRYTYVWQHLLLICFICRKLVSSSEFGAAVRRFANIFIHAKN